LLIVDPKDLHIDNNSSINIVVMNFLSIDCSTDLGTLFLKVKNKTFSKVLQSDKSNNDLLMQKILDFFTENNLNFGEVSAIFVNQGPGNFSGLRSSLSIAKGISLAKNINLFGYNVFLWSCAKFINDKIDIYSLIRFRDKYFIKKFDENLNSKMKAIEVTKEEIGKKFTNKLKVIPKQMTKNFDEKMLKMGNLNIIDLDHNELESLHLKGLLNKDLIKPFYLS